MVKRAGNGELDAYFQSLHDDPYDTIRSASNEEAPTFSVRRRRRHSLKDMKEVEADFKASAQTLRREREKARRMSDACHVSLNAFEDLAHTIKKRQENPERQSAWLRAYDKLTHKVSEKT